MHVKMTDYLVTQAQKALFALQSDTKQALGYITPKLALKMFDTNILPVLEYTLNVLTILSLCIMNICIPYL